MPQDYAKKNRSPNKSSPKRRTTKSKPAPRRVVPGWIWLVVGVLVGAFVMFLVRLSDVEPSKSSHQSTPKDVNPAAKLPPKQLKKTEPKTAKANNTGVKKTDNKKAKTSSHKTAPSESTKKSKQAVTSEVKEQPQKPRFDFYKMLKENEVPVFATPDDGSNKPAKPRTFILQVASFKSAADAEQLKVELILLGLESKAERVVVRNGEVWNRVLVGPFNDRSKLSKARNKLISNGHQALVMAFKADKAKAN